MTKQKDPPYLAVILLIFVFGVGAVVAIVTLRPDLDFIIVSGTILVVLTSLTKSLFDIMQKNQALQMTREANENSRLALDATKETHKLVNSQWDEFKAIFMEKERERSQLMADASFDEGRREGREDADKRTDKLSKKK